MEATTTTIHIRVPVEVQLAIADRADELGWTPGMLARRILEAQFLKDLTPAHHLAVKK